LTEKRFRNKFAAGKRLTPVFSEIPAETRVSGGWFLYILECGDGTLYTGITNDVSRRLEQHRLGKASRYTRSRLPVLLIFQEPCADRPAALRRELAVKKLPRTSKLALAGRRAPVEKLG